MRPARNQPSFTLAHDAFVRIREDIVHGRLQPGEKLKPDMLSGRYKLGFSPIREALSRLTSEGLVISEPQRGFRAAPISVADLKDLTMVRIEVESLCLRRAIEVGTVDWESRLVAAFHRLSKTPERVASDPVRSADDWAEIGRAHV